MSLQPVERLRSTPSASSSNAIDRLLELVACALGVPAVLLVESEGGAARVLRAHVDGHWPGSTSDVAALCAGAAREGRALPLRGEAKEGTVSALAVPVVGEQPSACCLGVLTRGPREWSETELAVLERAGAALGAVLASECMHAATRQELTTLQVAERRFHDLVHGVDAIVWEADPDTLRCSFVSERAESLLGYPIEEWLDDERIWARVIHPADLPSVFAACRMATADGQDHVLEYRALTADGRELWLRDIIRVVTDAAGRPSLLRGVIIDASEVRRAAEAVRASRDTLEALIDASPLAIVAGGLDERITLWNKAAERLFGWRAEEVLGRRYTDVLVPEERIGEFQTMRDALLAGEMEQGVETRRRRKDGSLVDVSIVTAPIPGPDARPRGAMVVISDITHRVRTEEQLRASEASYRSLFNSLTEAVYLVDHELRFRQVNDAVQRMYGYTPDEIIGQSPAMLAAARVDLVETAAILRRAAAGEPQRVEWWGRRKNGEEFPKEVVVTPGTAFGEDVLIIVARDISERKAAETALRESEEQLRSAQRMDALGKLTGGIAHDFNNLLTAITANTDILLSELEASHPFRQELVEIQGAAERAAWLTRQLLAFGRKQMLQPTVLDLNAVVARTDKLLRRLIGADVELVTLLEPALGAVRADPRQLEQVLMNLAVNARDAMPDGGKLVIETRNATGGPAGACVELRVRDTGVGMPREVQARAFEPFFTTKGPGKGTGLGLATVYGIVTQSGGTVRIESAPGAGTTFLIRLPRVEGEVLAPVSGERPALPARGTETVLVVEDDKSVRDVARRLLQRSGYTVLEAGNGDEALRMLEGNPALADLLVVDMVMPLLGGRELARRLRQAGLQVPIVFISGYTDERIGDVVGPDDAFVEKPFNLREFARTVRSVLDRVAS